MNTLIQKRARQQDHSIDDVRREYVSSTLLERMISENDVAEMVSFLASSCSDNITGQTMDVSAGYGLK